MMTQYRKKVSSLKEGSAVSESLYKVALLILTLIISKTREAIKMLSNFMSSLARMSCQASRNNDIRPTGVHP